jgi:hypothetical protein
MLFRALTEGIALCSNLSDWGERLYLLENILVLKEHRLYQDLRNWHIGRVGQISTICLFAGFMQ